MVARGQALYQTHCARCHGVAGKNDGPESERLLLTTADLTDLDGIAINPDDVVFYKIWNGKGGMIPHERMPGYGFSGVLSREEVWSVVAHVQTLRTKP